MAFDARKAIDSYNNRKTFAPRYDPTLYQGWLPTISRPTAAQLGTIQLDHYTATGAIKYRYRQEGLFKIALANTFCGNNTINLTLLNINDFPGAPRDKKTYGILIPVADEAKDAILYVRLDTKENDFMFNDFELDLTNLAEKDSKLIDPRKMDFVKRLKLLDKFLKERVIPSTWITKLPYDYQLAKELRIKKGVRNENNCTKINTILLEDCL